MDPQPAPRRSPCPASRQRDAERTKQKLLDAALDEFAAHGYAGARVSEIARRAGVNKQLISYYFGGKAAIYQALKQEWIAEEESVTDEAVPIQDMMRWYLRTTLSDQRGTRLLLWDGLTEPAPDIESHQEVDAEQEKLRRRQANGEIAADLDLAAIQLVWIGMMAAPVAFPQLVHKLFGVEAGSPEFQQRYGETLSRILSRLAEAPTDAPEGNPSP